MKANRRQQIINYLLTGKKLTAVTCLQELGFLALAQRISELIKLGYPICKEWHTAKNGSRYMVYYFEPSTIAKYEQGGKLC